MELVQAFRAIVPVAQAIRLEIPETDPVDQGTAPAHLEIGPADPVTVQGLPETDPADQAIRLEIQAIDQAAPA